jgi:hypothetical protein
LLQAHLYFDHIVTALLHEALANPDAISVGRLSFVQKLQVVQALALVPDELIAPIEFVNSLRNKIAHRLDFELGDQEERDLSNCIPRALRDIMQSDREREPGPLKFAELLRVLLLQTDVFRQKNALDRILERKARLRLQSVLDNTPGVIFRE